MDQKYKLLTDALLSIKNKEECNAFLEDICTIKEIDDLANRIYIAVLLSSGKTFLDVEEETGASSATISRVNRCLKYGEGYRRIIERIIENK